MKKTKARYKFNPVVVDPLTQRAQKTRSKKAVRGIRSPKPFRKKSSASHSGCPCCYNQFKRDREKKKKRNQLRGKGRSKEEVLVEKKSPLTTSVPPTKKNEVAGMVPCNICFENVDKDDVYYFNCKYWRVGKKKTDKAVCLSCLHKLNTSSCPFCRSHGFVIPSKEKKKRKKKVKKSSLLVQVRRIRLERIRAESYGLRCFGYADGETTASVLSDGQRISFRFFSVDGTSPLMANPMYHVGEPCEPTIYEQEGSNIRYEAPRREMPTIDLNSFTYRDPVEDWGESSSSPPPWGVEPPRFFETHTIDEVRGIGEAQERRFEISLDTPDTPLGQILLIQQFHQLVRDWGSIADRGY